MSENDRQAYHDLVRSTGRFKVEKREREETMNKIMGDLELELEDDSEPTLELPIRRS